jgi:molybdopterin-guanine dinucleotide biosynthesis protein A
MSLARPIDLADVTLAVLAGGEGSRMGRPKALLEVNGQPILDWLLDQFRWPGPTLLVTAPGREHPPGAERFDREVLDEIAGQGPLRGVLTALDASRTELLLVTTVDMPHVGPEQAKWLVEQLGDHAGVMCRRGNQAEPFPLVLRRATRDTVRDTMNAGERSVRSLSRSVCVVVSPGWSDDVWTNLNRPEDLTAWRAAIPDPPGAS